MVLTKLPPRYALGLSGRVFKSAWTKKGGDFELGYHFAGQYVGHRPDLPKEKIDVTVGNLPGVRRVSATEGYMEVEIGSGSYHFGK